MGRPGTKITSFPPQAPAPLPPALPTVSVQPLGNSTLPTPLPLQPQNIGLPPELVAEEPITFPADMTIDDLIETRRNVGNKSPIYWAAFDEIQRKRDEMFEIHHNSLMKAIQDLTISMYKTKKMKIPEGVGKPFESD